MNARADDASLLAALAADPLAGVSMDRTAIADLAFGSFSRSRVGTSIGRHLAMLTADALELDLSDPAQRQFGDYELLEMIGEGGMGVVYRARQHSLDRDVAVKLLAAGPWASNDFIERFRREAQNAARMQHPNIVAIYEVGSAEELHFFSMRLIRGGSLSSLLKRDGRLAPLRAAQLLRTIAEAVDYAHRLGVLHLDLKPANVLLDDNGAPHVADFGLARRFEQGITSENNEVSGTPSYMAPEQALAGAQQITPATDIWGLGAILYELVCGTPPFLGDSPHATLKLVVTGTLTSPRELVPQLPRDLEAIILKCMARDVAQRYPGGRALADDIGRYLENRPVQARPLNPPQRTWRWARRQPYLAALAALFALSLILGIIGVSAQWRRAEGNAQRAEASAQQASANAAVSKQLLWSGRNDIAQRLMRDGKGFEALGPLLANIEEKEASGKSAAASVERREVGMIEHQGVTLIDRLIIADANPMATALSPDGSTLAVSFNDISVRWFDTATLTERGRVDLSDAPTSDGVPRVPVLLRFVDNHRLRVTGEWFSMFPSPGNGDTWLVDLDLAQLVAPPPAFADLADITFSADGRHALLRAQGNQVQLWQTEPWRPLSPLVEVGRTNAENYWLLDPQLRYALNTDQSMVGLELYDPRSLTKHHLLQLPPHESISAWIESHDGSRLALGTSDGQVIIVDLGNLSARKLPGPAGGNVSWLAFSEDDAWLAAVRRDGAAFAFDLASGDLIHTGFLQHDFKATHVEVNHDYQMMIVSGLVETGAGDCVIWHLPAESPVRGEATHLLSSPTRPAKAGPYWISVSFAAGLVATADAEGELRLWRLPHPALQAAQPSRQVSGSLYTDGAHLVDVEYDRLRVTAVGSRRATPWLDLPAPIAFAQLADGGKTLVAASRSSLHVLDAATLAPRLSAIALRGTPQRMVIDAKARLAVLSFGHNGAAGFEERIESYDLTSGAPLGSGDAAVKGPLRQLELSADASRVLATGPIDGATTAFDARSLRRLGSFPHDRMQPVIWASFSADSQQLWLVTRSMDETQADNAELIRWEPASDTVRERRHVAGAYPIGITTVADKPLLASTAKLILDPGAPDERVARIPRLGSGGGEATATFAFSHDGRLLANGTGREIQIYDTASMIPIGAPLQSDAPPMSIAAQLAFTDDDSALLARMLANKPSAYLWSTAADDRSIAALREDTDLLLPLDTGPRVLRIADQAERERLRRQDPGPADAEPRPPRGATRLIGGEPVPPRDPHTDPLLLDLAGTYNIAPTSVHNILDSVMPMLAELPFGTLRVDGTDYDVRGALELRWGAPSKVGTRFQLNLPTAVAGVHVPPLPIAALHVLMYAPQGLPTADVQPYANVRLHYRDGSQALLALRTQREVSGWTDHDQATPVGWVMGDHLRLLGVARQKLFNNPRVANPHPERLIDTLDLETVLSHWSTPVFFAITAEPVTAAGGSGTASREAANQPRDGSHP